MTNAAVAALVAAAREATWALQYPATNTRPHHLAASLRRTATCAATGNPTTHVRELAATAHRAADLLEGPPPASKDRHHTVNELTTNAHLAEIYGRPRQAT